MEADREPHLETEDIPPEEDVVAQSDEPGERWIDIDRSEVIVTLYEGPNHRWKRIGNHTLRRRTSRPRRT